MASYQTRIAPTPSGYLHLGNAYNFLLIQAWADQLREIGQEVTVQLRIDDLDRKRTKPEYVQHIFDLLSALGITPDKGPSNVREHDQHFSQQLRLNRYHQLIDDLLTSGYLYACQCSRTTVINLIEQANLIMSVSISCPCYGGVKDGPHQSNALLINQAPDHCLRLIPTAWAEVLTQINQLPQGHRTDVTAMPPVIRRRDHLPAYHIATLADDADNGITHILRGQDLLPSTILQQHLAQWLGLIAFTNIQFRHHGLLLNADGQKLSKSAGANHKGCMPTVDQLKHLKKMVIDYDFGIIRPT